MTSIRVMFVGQGPSLLPEDRVVNVFHFHTPTVLPYDAHRDFAFGSLEAFYTTTASGGNIVGSFISPWVSRNAKLVAYNLAEPEPRVPSEHAIVLPATVPTGLPEEVAVVLTLEGAPPVTRRRRGRIYLGPLSDWASGVIKGSTTDACRPAMSGSEKLGPVVLAAAQGLMDDQNGDGVPWCIRSTTPSENFVPIVGGYIDNAFDTQRRRGPADTARLTFGA